MISSWNYIVELRFAFCDRLEGEKKKNNKKENYDKNGLEKGMEGK